MLAALPTCWAQADRSGRRRTGMIGDLSGKSEEQILSPEQPATKYTGTAADAHSF